MDFLSPIQGAASSRGGLLLLRRLNEKERASNADTLLALSKAVFIGVFYHFHRILNMLRSLCHYKYGMFFAHWTAWTKKLGRNPNSLCKIPFHCHDNRYNNPTRHCCCWKNLKKSWMVIHRKDLLRHNSWFVYLLHSLHRRAPEANRRQLQRFHQNFWCT